MEQEKKQVGRKKTDKPKKERLFTVRLDDEMYEQLNSDTMLRIFELQNIDTLSAYIRMLLKVELRKAGLR